MNPLRKRGADGGGGAGEVTVVVIYYIEVDYIVLFTLSKIQAKLLKKVK